MSKNLQKVQDMLDGNHKNKIQVGYSKNEETRKVGDTWIDSDGKKWIQKDGYYESVRNTPSVGLFSKVCKDCSKNCSSKSYDDDTFKRMGRCYSCQVHFEEELKWNPKNKIGKKSNKWEFWVRLQELQRWIDGRKELEQWIDEQHKLNSQPMYTGKVANAMANANVSMEINKNKS
tara:strand:- start:44 stop:568 length:525 start_codon:yes stop_codon:yes gene_type:complete